jgi:hypothetical protein
VALRDGCLRLSEMEEIPLQRRVRILQDVCKSQKGLMKRSAQSRYLEKSQRLSRLKSFRNPLLFLSYKPMPIKSIIRLARPIGAVYPEQAISALERIKSKATDEAIRKQSEQTIAAVKNAGLSPDGSILAWLICGPFTKEGKMVQHYSVKCFRLNKEIQRFNGNLILFLQIKRTD